MNLTAFRQRCAQFVRQFHLHGRRGPVLAGALALLALPMPFGDRSLALLRYDRAGLAAGDCWRLVTGHLVHLDAGHALGNMAGLALLWALFAGSLPARAWGLVLLASAGAIDAGLWWFAPAVAWYAGLSGVLHGAWAAGAAEGAAHRDPVSIGLGGALVLKLAWELVHGASPLHPGMAVVVEAHAWGALGGLLAWRIARPRRPAREPL